MDPDDLAPRRRDDPLAALARQDLDPLSLSELDERIAALEAEAERCRAHRGKASSHRADAESLFRK